MGRDARDFRECNSQRPEAIADVGAPCDRAALAFLTMTTKPSFLAEFKEGEDGKAAVYMLRWVHTCGEKGPWSEITTATVAACGATVAA